MPAAGGSDGAVLEPWTGEDAENHLSADTPANAWALGDNTAPPGDLEPPSPGMLPDKASSWRVFYDAFGTRYTPAVYKWGYAMPDQIATLVADHSSGDKGSHHILDAGAGDGLVGAALRSAGFLPPAYIAGADISGVLLEIARARSLYDSRKEADLGRPLDFYPSGTFDAVVCAGTLAYIPPSSGVLAEFVRVSRVGGLVSFNIRADHAEAWREAMAELEASGAWELVERLADLPYLPQHPAYRDRVLTHVYLYRVLSAGAAAAPASKAEL
jgi:SAM-dependent methyltransferase